MRFGSEHMTLFKMDLEAGPTLDQFTSFRVGGPADLLARPKTIEQLRSLIETAGKNKIPVTILGGGTNTLVSDRGIRGLVILLTALKTAPKRIQDGAGCRITALAGERLSTLCHFALERELSGLEWAAGIPGTLGGAIMMNAGAFGSDMASVTESVQILDQTGVKTILAKNLDFSYRRLNLADTIILKTTLALTPGNPDEIKTAFQKNLAAKRSGQPVSKASGGCFFKNPSPRNPAGRLIEKAGLKGQTLKGAMVSDCHANFIINYDNARCKDILALKQLVQDRVHKQFGIRLESEVKAIGD